MRIIAGAHRGLILVDVGRGDPAAQLRPTSDRVREAMFNVLAGGRFGEVIVDAVVLDLFAGTGALGLEALSRGAESVTFIEQGRVGQGLIRDNIARTKRQADTKLIAADATALPPLPAGQKPATLVFLDPPYGRDLGRKALLAAEKSGWLAEDAFIVWEEATPQAPPPGFKLQDQRRYGDTHVTCLLRDRRGILPLGG